MKTGKALLYSGGVAIVSGIFQTIARGDTMPQQLIEYSASMFAVAFVITKFCCRD